ncbi:hypothetical protein [Flavobacterium sp.]|uniref:hypothetical protein n=1 Tax=Flavobacterium sp. TaxID=239 RepID=UPI003F6A3381
MKNFLFLLFLVHSGIFYSQDLDGKWKVISYEDEIIYYNKVKDSLKYKDINRKEEAENFKEMADFLIFPISYQFNNKKILIILPMMDEISGDFENDKLNKKIIFTDKTGKKDEIPYTFENETLFIEMKISTGFIKLGLIKQ